MYSDSSIDTYTKYLWVNALKYKLANKVTRGTFKIFFLKIVQNHYRQYNGKECYNKPFDDNLIKKYNIKRYSTYCNGAGTVK